MIVAIVLALAFWAPYNGGPVCGGTPQGVHISYEHFASADQAGASWTGVDDCNIELAYWVKSAQIPEQCAYVAHELGHNVMGLEHSLDPNNIMYQYVPIPSACHLRFQKAKRPH